MIYVYLIILKAISFHILKPITFTKPFTISAPVIHDLSTIYSIFLTPFPTFTIYPIPIHITIRYFMSLFPILHSLLTPLIRSIQPLLTLAFLPSHPLNLLHHSYFIMICDYLLIIHQPFITVCPFPYFHSHSSIPFTLLCPTHHFEYYPHPPFTSSTILRYPFFTHLHPTLPLPNLFFIHPPSLFLLFVHSC